MRRFFRTFASSVPAIAIILVMALAAGSSCTSVDDTLGQNFIPEDQEMRLRIAETISAPKTYIAQNDTVLSSNQGMLFLGSMTDQTFGRMLSSAMTDFFPYIISKYTLSQADEEEEEEEEEEEVYFGYNPTADSAFVDLLITSIHGTPKEGQIINIYEIRDSLRRDSIYFFTTPIQDHANLDRPLFSFEIGSDFPANTQIRRKLTPTAEGLEFIQRLVDLGDDVYSDPQYAFHKNFYGLYLAPASGYPEDGAVYEFDLRSQDGDGFFYSSMIVWAHNYDQANPTEVLDTMLAYYLFSDTYYPIKNMNVNRTEFTYPQQIASRLNDTLPESAPLSTVYAQGLGGVATYLRFTDEMLEEINKLKEVSEDEVYSTLVINNATIYFPFEDPSLENRDMAATRLGMFYTYGQPMAESASSYYPFFFTVPYFSVTPAYGPKPILDYNYAGENIPTYYGTPTQSSYDGHLYRTQGYYRMNISYYLTLLLNYPDTTPRDIWLGPEVNTRHRDYTQVVLKGSDRPDTEENRIKLVLTYTLVR